jgi:multiple sugar transport system ATP-binding protein
MHGVRKEVITERVENVARTLGIESLLERKPAQLSGGQRQRVALGRAIVREPQAFLLDEPLSNLDVKLRVETRAELARLHRRLGATMLYVTHDQEEAMMLGDRVAVMHGGQLQQVAPPMDVYRQPANLFVAGFLGSPAMNFFRGTVQEEGGRVRFTCSSFALDVGEAQRVHTKHGEVVLGVRPHDLMVADRQEADLVARVDVIEPQGNELVIHLERGENSGQDMTVVVPPEEDVAVNDQIGLRVRRDRFHLFESMSGERVDRDPP